MGIKLPDTHTPANLGKSMCVSKFGEGEET